MIHNSDGKRSVGCGSESDESRYLLWRTHLKHFLHTMLREYPWLARRVDSSDLAQDALIKALRLHDQRDKNYTVEQWLHLMARNAVDEARRFNIRQRRSIAREKNLPNTSGGHGHDRLADSATTPSQVAMRQELSAFVNEALDCLKPQHRSIFVLRFVLGMSIEKIAQVENISMGNVRLICHRAKRRINAYVGARTDVDE